jgi:hypothetical protein
MFSPKPRRKLVGVLLCTGGAYNVLSCLLISNKFCNGGGGGAAQAELVF